MGNKQVIDILIRVGEKCVSPSSYKQSTLSPLPNKDISLFEIKNSFDVYINTKGKELKTSSFNIDNTANDVIVFSDKLGTPTDYDNAFFKTTLKKEISDSISLISTTTEFQNFLKKLLFTTKEDLITTLDSFVDNFVDVGFSYNKILKGFLKESNSSFEIIFKDASDYHPTFIYFAHNNFQSLYISCVIKLLLDMLKENGSTSKIGAYITGKLDGIRSGEKNAVIFSFILCVISVMMVVALYYYIKYKKNIASKCI